MTRALHSLGEKYSYTSRAPSTMNDDARKERRDPARRRCERETKGADS